MEEVSVLRFRQMDGTNTAVPAMAVRVLFGFHIREIKEQIKVQGRNLLRCLFYSQFVIKSIYSAAVERIFSDRHLIAQLRARGTQECFRSSVLCHQPLHVFKSSCVSVLTGAMAGCAS